jgi:hypothetical protein
MALIAVGVGASTSASAVEPYVATGFPYALVGVSQALNSRFTVRADFGTVAHHNYTGSTTDEDYKGVVNYSRTALVGDWFVAGNGFRLTGGATFNTAKLSMRATAHNGQIVIGGTTYQAPSDLYYVQSEVALPNVTPYLGLGWGHHDDLTAGFAFNFDLGASIGTAKATPLSASPALLNELSLTSNGQGDLATENRRFQDGVAKFKAIPQLTFGVGYRF